MLFLMYRNLILTKKKKKKEPLILFQSAFCPPEHIPSIAESYFTSWKLFEISVFWDFYLSSIHPSLDAQQTMDYNAP